MSQVSVHYPRVTVDSQKYWDGCKEGKLLYQRCSSCNEVVFHPRAACPYCFQHALTWQESGGKGKIYSFSVQYLPVDRENPGKLPLTVGIIEMDEGYHMFSEIDCTDLDVLKIGLPVEVYFDPVAADLTLPKFSLQDLNGQD